MLRLVHRSVLIALLASTASLAQAPPHATQLNPTTQQQRPRLVQNGDYVHAFGQNTTTIYHARSSDGGRTWPLREQSLGAVALGLYGGQQPPAAAYVGAGQLLVLAEDDLLGPRIIRSSDFGATWSAPVSVASTVMPQFFPMRPAMYVDGSNVVVVWTNDRSTGRVFCNRSTDGGLTWQATDTVLDVTYTSSMPSIDNLHVVGIGSVVNVFWYDYTLRQQRSVDGGATWLPASGSIVGVGNLANKRPVKAGAGSSSLAMLVDSELVRSLDGGVTWSVVTNHGLPRIQDFAIDGDVVVVTGRDYNTWAPTLFANASGNQGGTWGANPLQIQPSWQLSIFQRAHAHDGVAYVNWEVVDQPGNVAHSDDFGASWQAIDGPVQAGFSPGATRTIQTARTHTGGGVYDYYVYAGVGSTVRGASTVGSGGVAPRLTTSGLPVRGRSTTVQMHDALGGSAAALAVSVGPPAAIPFGAATIYLSSLDLLLSFATGGIAGQPGTGGFQFVVPVPNDPALVGSRLAAQAMSLDPGVPDGFAMTNAVEVWLR